MNEAGAKIDFECGKMSLTDIGRAPLVHTQLSTEGAALTVFAHGKEGHGPQPCIREARHRDVQFSASPHPETTADQSRTWLVKIKENITLAPRCRQIVTGVLDSGKEQSLPPLVCV
jgi:hypothetical protein